MGGTRSPVAATLALVCWAVAAQAQRPARSVWPDHTWLHGTINDHGACAGHLCAHLIGGAVSAGLARGPWFAASWRRSFKGRLALAAIPQLWWEAYQQVEHQEPLQYGAWDLVTGLVGSTVTDLLLSRLGHRGRFPPQVRTTP